MGRSLLRWSRRIAAGLLLLCLVAWLWAEADQWLLRRRAEHLLADIQSIQVGKTTDAEAWRIMEKWGRWNQHYGDRCKQSDCSYNFRMTHLLPFPFSFDIYEFELDGDRSLKGMRS